ncbi:methylmalonate-semialdehyde dehydrogenase [Planctomycetaceae bacterium SCGC AG-212-D15]|nr:methylmalonate-semialdehyde dehydrogenase [Planctomycetaceae bacterium SCGC AG-212-D15]
MATVTQSAVEAKAAGVTGPANLIGGRRVESRGPVSRDICNPADTAEVIAPVREASVEQVDEACAAAARAFPGWRATPPPDRARVLFQFRELLETHFLELAHCIVHENGKLLSEAKGSLRRGIDVVEYACGIPAQLLGRTLTDVSRDVDCYTVREPLGVVAGIPPFNFPAMIPLWMMPIAVACGNAFILKPAEKAPLTGTRLVELFADAGLPPGVVSVVQGGKEVSERLITNPHVQAVSFVGSSAVAESVYRTAAAHGKRVQALGGAKNHLIVLPDAELERSLPALIGSCFGCAGQRCLAGSVLVAVGDRARQDAVVQAFVRAAGDLKLGDGLDEAATLGPVVNKDQERRVREAIERGVSEGAKLRLDGRAAAVPKRPRGCFIGATVFDDVTPDMFVGKEEIFGPVVSVMRAGDLDEAILLANRSRYGNSVSLFTRSGSAARAFRERIQAGMLGINLGVPAPMAFFSFGGWKQSIFGDLHAHGADAVAFYTRNKVISERWFGAEAPKDGWV